MDDETFSAILAQVSAGEPIRRVLREREISARSFYAMLDSAPAVSERYARAKYQGLDRLAEEIIELADESRRGVKTTTKADGSVETVDGDMVERSRLQIDSRKWLLSKLAPKKYGDRLELAGDPEAPIKIDVTATDDRL